MNLRKTLIAACLLALAMGCKDDDGRDDTILEMDYIVGKDWYYNAWMGNKEGMRTEDLLEVVHFEKGGVLKTMEFGGRQEKEAGTWEKDGNRLMLHYTDGKDSRWDILRSGEDYIRALVDDNVRDYASSLNYLRELTADAFLVNEYDEYDNQYATYIGADVRGNIDLREGMLLLGDGDNTPLTQYDYYWTGHSQYELRDWDEECEARIYVRLGEDHHVKLSDVVYSENLTPKSPAEVALEARCSGGKLNVSWNPYTGQQVYYRVEILSLEDDKPRTYFVSRVQPVGANQLTISSNTTSEVDRLSELKSNQGYRLRLTALLYEPDVDPLNDLYAYANLQAVAYFETHFIWE